MKQLTVLLIFIFSIGFVFGCNPVPAARSKYLNKRNMALKDLEYRERNWESSKEQFTKDVAKWNNLITISNIIKREFIQTLNDDQLELYSLYNESVKIGENNMAKTELDLRKLNRALNEKQKTKLANIRYFEKNLEIEGNKLLKRKNELNREKDEIMAKAKRIESVHREFLQIEGMAYNQSTNFYNNIQQSLYQWQEYQQKDAMIRSLNNISSAIRGY